MLDVVRKEAEGCDCLQGGFLVWCLIQGSAQPCPLLVLLAIRWHLTSGISIAHGLVLQLSVLVR